MGLRVVLAGGGTAGHVSPLLALADALMRRDADTEIVVLGTAAGLEARLVPAAGYRLHTIPRVPLPRKPSPDMLKLPVRLRAAIKSAGKAIDELEADVVVGVGGYVATPAYLAARRRGVPIVVHEANSKPGIANRIGSRFATRVATAFPGTALRGAAVVGMPMREGIAELDRRAARPQAAARLGLAPEMPTLLVTGGSLGAMRLNTSFADGARGLSDAGIQVLHVAGSGKTDTIAELVDLPNYHLVDYVDGMENAYAVADLIVCRAGAGTVSEVTAVGLPAVYVPLPIGNGEQLLNAQPAVDAAAAIVYADSDFTAETVTGPVRELTLDPDRLAAMSAGAERLGVRDGAQRLADLVVEAAEAGGVA
ncbi:undecaprenyldiphospho-muramoylpentapeptide beta-N-acetylglucosaminyltransferase [Spelaeicoccus albus]|uniref:UDP-N-acetylglucosamine--N-acetylmuramyl-(pentapeptide) pyrophosphoryl-undecaprenol N-acetylglucosamine transferase n=1 Tax=Spelaeicoccus albus TaxID=1280376 RepID=A0A7Z0IIY7_9MICO|nr:undecaprenyldiphospho-muramoylpentapeptide beta-N-acetylglucosaminyltransferase [Spelaeicoccus albus]NYI68990.1 undecaprenyldiphospho-muramoylpentapeptide beta-N-acetylglucosaminyltransferase [Spelaeicoccus albus]